MKIIGSAWWDIKGIIHWKILPASWTVITDLYYQQLDRVATELHGKQQRIDFLLDNPRLHVAKSTREKWLKLRWITLAHAPYSPDLVPTDSRMFRCLSNYFGEKKFDQDNELKTDLANFFALKSQDF